MVVCFVPNPLKAHKTSLFGQHTLDLRVDDNSLELLNRILSKGLSSIVWLRIDCPLLVVSHVMGMVIGLK